MRRWAIEPISATAIAIWSAAKATGSAWKLPPETIALRRGRAGCRLPRWPRSRACGRPGAAGRCRRRPPAAGSGCSRGPARGCRPRGGFRGSPSPPSARASRAAASIWPRWPRSAWISGRKGAAEPMIASVESAGDEQRGQRGAPGVDEAGERQAVETCVPLIRARPSLAAERDRRQAGRGEGRRRRHARGRRAPASPSPIITAVIWASGARSPEAPTEPWPGRPGSRRAPASPRSAR